MPILFCKFVVNTLWEIAVYIMQVANLLNTTVWYEAITVIIGNIVATVSKSTIIVAWLTGSDFYEL